MHRLCWMNQGQGQGQCHWQPIWRTSPKSAFLHVTTMSDLSKDTSVIVTYRLTGSLLLFFNTVAAWRFLNHTVVINLARISPIQTFVIKLQVILGQEKQPVYNLCEQLKAIKSKRIFTTGQTEGHSRSPTSDLNLDDSSACIQPCSASEMTCIVSSGALNSTHSLTHPTLQLAETFPKLFQANAPASVQSSRWREETYESMRIGRRSTASARDSDYHAPVSAPKYAATPSTTHHTLTRVNQRPTQRLILRNTDWLLWNNMKFIKRHNAVRWLQSGWRNR